MAPTFGGSCSLPSWPQPTNFPGLPAAQLLLVDTQFPKTSRRNRRLTMITLFDQALTRALDELNQHHQNDHGDQRMDGGIETLVA